MDSRDYAPEVKKENSTPAVSVKKPEPLRDAVPTPTSANPVPENTPPAPENTQKETSSETPATPFDFSRFVEHIRTVPKRSFV